MPLTFVAERNEPSREVRENLEEQDGSRTVDLISPTALASVTQSQTEANAYRLMTAWAVKKLGLWRFSLTRKSFLTAKARWAANRCRWREPPVHCPIAF